MPEVPSTLPCVEIETGETPTHSILWLHGLGADGHDFEPIVPELGLDDLALRFVFPHAPKIPVTLNGGMVMPAWYDIRVLDLRRDHDEEGVRRSAASLFALMRRENARGVPTSRIFLAGFSQGGAIALHCGLRSQERPAGLIALSTYLVSDDSIDDELEEAVRGLAVFHAHGTLDPMVTIDRGRAARSRLEALGFDVESHEYPMPHAVCAEEIQALGAWLRTRITATS